MADRTRVTSDMGVSGVLENSKWNVPAPLRERVRESLIFVRVEPDEMSGLFFPTRADHEHNSRLAARPTRDYSCS
jgi:hypothetical protein